MSKALCRLFGHRWGLYYACGTCCFERVCERCNLTHHRRIDALTEYQLMRLDQLMRNVPEVRA